MTKGVEDGMGQRSVRAVAKEAGFQPVTEEEGNRRFDNATAMSARAPEQPSMSTGDAEPLREDTITFVYDGMEAVTHACGLLDVIKQEWDGMWTEHDQAVRDGLSRMLSTSLYAKENEQAFDMQNPRMIFEPVSTPSLSPEIEQLLREIHGEHDRNSAYGRCACWSCVRIDTLLDHIEGKGK